MTRIVRTSRSRTAVVVAAALVAAVPTVAQGAGWPQHGNDAGHSSNQIVDQGGLPIPFIYNKGGSDSGIRTTPIITNGAPRVQRITYMNFVASTLGPIQLPIARVHIQRLHDGTPIGPETGQFIDDLEITPNGPDDLLGVDSDAFLGGVPDPAPNTAAEQGSVAPVEASAPSGLGQLYVVHNDDDQLGNNNNNPGGPGLQLPPGPDIAIAQIDPEDGSVVRDVPIPDTGNQFLIPPVQAMSDEFTVSASPVLTPPRANGDRLLFFSAAAPPTAACGTDPIERIYRVTIPGAHQRVHGPLQFTSSVTGANPCGDVDVNTLASPAIVNLQAPGRNAIAEYAVFGSVNSSELRFFLGADISTTNAVPLDPAGDPAADLRTPGTPVCALDGTPAGTDCEIVRVSTPAVPIAPNGDIPGTSGSGVDRAPFIYAPVTVIPPPPPPPTATGRSRPAGRTVINKMFQAGDEQVLRSERTSGVLGGTAAPVPLALSQGASPGSATPGAPPTQGGRLAITTNQNMYLLDADDLADRGRFSTGTADFGRNSVAISGDFLYASSSNGAQHVLRANDLQRVALSDFTEVQPEVPSNFSVGGPAISRGFVAFASNLGLYVYRNRDLQPPVISIEDPASDDARLSGGIRYAARAYDNRELVHVRYALEGVSTGTTPRADLGTITVPQGNQYDPPGALFPAGEPYDTRVVPDGIYNLRATARDEAGLEASAVRRVIIDNFPDPVGRGRCVVGFRGTDGSDTIIGTANGDSISGLGGNDVLSGAGFQDCLTGGSGNDRMRGGGDRDTLRGGAGNDQLFGDSHNDRLFADSGNDRLTGGSGSDVLSGGTGRDRLDGGSGNDRLRGGPGNDRLTGGSGKNTYSGGTGNDYINAANGRAERIFCGGGRDRVVADRNDVVLRGCESIRRRRR